jgi:hypothetical protein
MSILERTDGKWGSRIIIIDDQPRQPPKAVIFKHFLKVLSANPNCMKTLTELAETGDRGELPQYAINEIINRVLKGR